MGVIEGGAAPPPPPNLGLQISCDLDPFSRVSRKAFMASQHDFSVGSSSSL
jgi:hypothetical protein